MKLFDTHVHLDDEQFDEDRSELINLIRNSEVELVVNAGANLATSINSVDLAQEQDFIYAAVGIHPHDVGNYDESALQELRTLASKEKVVAIGEIGLDYYYDNSPREVQKDWFAKQIQLAEELKLPFIVHARDASEDTLKIIRENKINSRFVLHCYSQSIEMAKEYLKLGGYISFAGPVTYKKSTSLREVVKHIPRDRILIETDCPYLSPEPFRGKRNNPIRVIEIARVLADILEIEVEELASITFENGKRFFGI